MIISSNVKKVEYMLWLKALHVIFVVCWFAGLFYLPRLFVYHAMSDNKAVSEQLKVMEHKLYYYIMWPSLIGAAFFGLWMLFSRHHYYAHQMWMHFKLISVMILVAYHLLCGRYLSDFKHDRNKHSHKFYRYFNEIPSVFLVLIIILSFVKP